MKTLIVIGLIAGGIGLISSTLGYILDHSTIWPLNSALFALAFIFSQLTIRSQASRLGDY